MKSKSDKIVVDVSAAHEIMQRHKDLLYDLLSEHIPEGEDINTMFYVLALLEIASEFATVLHISSDVCRAAVTHGIKAATCARCPKKRDCDAARRERCH